MAAKLDSYRKLLALKQGTDPDTDTDTESEQKPERKARKKKGESAIEKTIGHDLVNGQRADTNQVMSALEKGEEALNATIGYQRGQYLADLRLAGSTAGFLDRYATAKIDNLGALKNLLEANARDYNPLSILADLGLADVETVDGDGETLEPNADLKDKSKAFAEEDYSAFLH